MTDRADTCPICGFAGDSRSAVYEHLLTSHRKRAISNVLLETTSTHSNRR